MKSHHFPILLLFLLFTGCAKNVKEYHVSPEGSDSNKGSENAPLKTISTAADLAMPGNVIIVHEGIYRERIKPPRGGTSDTDRIVYQAAPGEEVVIKGSEEVKGWENVQDDTWKVTLPNTFFGDFNPYVDQINGDWFNPKGRVHHTGAVYLNGHWLTEAAQLDSVLKPTGDTPLWFAEAESSPEANTVIWAQFPGIDPNAANVEINVRQSVFYPEKPGINYITVRGFTMEQAATPWAPPTAEQIGLIGTHWSKGWIIEENTIRYSTCVGVTLGKYGDQWDNTSANSAEGYVKTIERAVEVGWTKETVGSHLVRNNTISHCEQAGIVGSLGAIFSQVLDNEIHDIHIRQLFTGAEMAGIKFHASIDAIICGNHIYRANRGIWLDWMTQGTRVTQNLLHDNGPSEDLFLEVNHGPYLVDNNILLSPRSLLVNSQGGAYVHNLFAGDLRVITTERRLTPYHTAHSTEVVGLSENVAGDERFYNNIFVEKTDLSAYDNAGLPVWMDGNVFLHGAKPGKFEKEPQVDPDFDPGIQLLKKEDGIFLEISLDRAWASDYTRKLITTDVLGKAVTPDLPYEYPDGIPYRIDTDYVGRRRNTNNPFPGPFVKPETDRETIKVWKGK